MLSLMWTAPGPSLMFLHPLLVPPDFGPPLILLLPLTSQVHPLLMRPGLIALDAPSPPPFPVLVITPAPPVPLEPPVGNPLIIPPVSVPVMIPVVSSPARVHIKIEGGGPVIIGPAPVIIM